MKKILFAAVALVAASALPAAAQTINWGGSFAGNSQAGSTTTGFGGSNAAGSAATNGWATGTGNVAGGAINIPGFGVSAGLAQGSFSSGIQGVSGANATSGTGFLGSTMAESFGSSVGSSAGSVQLRP
ncbi:hypothetical protein ACFOLL_06890 [Falsochrobactrum ovis]|uniref:Uncharacterized protein n=1 Tax=Falsochrobactrum ovis TaxID=1293442 RepID=A0A364JZL5_9HYPH|nr:hypothetical protein [Falsochrobactrum ovis]RAK34090.1 hypothetical protein C7374_101419 [Falsochrobactrum ovis]